MPFAADIGGTSIRVSMVDTRYDHYTLTEPIRFSTDPARGFNSAMDELAAGLKDLAIQNDIPLSSENVGVASAGPISMYDGTYDFSPNLPGWQGHSVSRALEEILGVAVYTAHDGAMGVLAESKYGQHPDTANLIYVTVSTGIGAGIIANGEIVAGRQSGAGEVGHMIVMPGRGSCNNGCDGCLEGVSSGTAIARRAHALMENTQDGMLNNTAGPVTAADVVAAARAGDSLAISVIEDALEGLANGLSGLLAIFDPDVIVLGGGVIDGLGHRWDELLERTQHKALPRYKHVLPVSKTILGGDAPLIGAAVFASQQKEVYQA